MGTIDISYLSLGIGLLLLLIPLFYIWKFKTGLLRATVIGTARMIVQLFFIGIADGIGTNTIEEEDSAPAHIRRFLMQCSMCRLVLYRNSTESGKRIQRPVFHPYFRHTDGQHAIQ